MKKNKTCIDTCLAHSHDTKHADPETSSEDVQCVCMYTMFVCA